jgi:7-carboxy-7-deazaguanine synthase
MNPTLRVYSIFTSIQGESTYAGLPCVFVRLAGCPLHCRYCDTRKACESAGTEMTVAEILDRVAAAKVPLVEVTGGEPLAQDGTLELLQRLNDCGYGVLLETSGALGIGDIDPRTVVIMDVKTPGSGVAEHLCVANMGLLTRAGHQVKFVVTSRQDFDYAVDVVDQYHLRDRVEVLISPVAGIDPAQVARWILDSQMPFRLQLQLHRVIWPLADAQGQER